MATIKGKVKLDLNISLYEKSKAIEDIELFEKQQLCPHDGNIIEEEFIHPHAGREFSMKQCVKCGKIL